MLFLIPGKEVNRAVNDAPGLQVISLTAQQQDPS